MKLLAIPPLGTCHKGRSKHLQSILHCIPIIKINLVGTDLRALLRIAECCVLFSCISVTVLAQAELLLDINDSQENTYNEFSNLKDGIGKAYYVSEGQHLWINFLNTNSEEVAVKLVSFVHIDQLVMVGTTLYFSADDGSHGEELWKSNGTAAGTVMVKDIWPGGGSGAPLKLTAVKGQLYFTATNSLHGRELWKSNGSSAGTFMIKDIFPKLKDSNPAYVTNVDGIVYFSATDGAHGYELWKSDGTATGTFMVKDIRPPPKIGSVPKQIINVNGIAYFTATEDDSGRELYRSNGTASGTIRVMDIRPGKSSSGIENMTAMNSALYFTANDGKYGHELWKSSGTAASTVLLKDMTPGYEGSHGGSSSSFRMANFKNISGTLFYTAYKEDDYYIWTSDGTPAGTVARYRAAGPDHVQPRPFFTEMNGMVFFFNSQYPDGEYDFYDYSLFKTDLKGSLPEPELVLELFNNAPTPYYPEMVVVKDFTNANHLYLNGTDGWGGITLFKSDGTQWGTEKLYTDPYVATQSSSPHNFIPFKGKIVFLAQYQFYGSHDIYITDGTTAGTRSLLGFQGQASEIVATNNFIYGSGMDQFEIYKTAEDYPGAYGYTEWIDYYAPPAIKLTPVNENIFFTNRNGELWKIDGASEELSLLRTMNNISEMKALGTNLIFRVKTANNGEELWRSNGTASGTYRYKTFRTGQAVAPLLSPSATIKNTHYFIAHDGVHGNEVWRTQGTGSSTYMLADLNTNDPLLANGMEYDISTLAAFRDSLYISAIGNDGKWSLFKCKGNATAVSKVANINAVKMMVPVGNKLYLFTYGPDQRTGLTLWTTNGTASGTTLVKDLPPSESIQYYITDGILYFNLNDGSHLWRSDGTECGTYSFETGVPSFDLTGISSTLIFNGFIFKLGMEPYIYNTAWVPDSPCDPTLANASSDAQKSTAYPNPFTDELMLRVPGEDNEFVSVVITTISGIPVEKIEGIHANTDHPIGKSWVPGMYILSVLSRRNISSTIIVKK